MIALGRTAGILFLVWLGGLSSSFAQELIPAPADAQPAQEQAFFLLGGDDDVAAGTVTWNSSNEDSRSVVTAEASFPERNATVEIVIGRDIEGGFAIDLTLVGGDDLPLEIGNPIVFGYETPGSDAPASLDALPTYVDLGANAWRILYRSGLSDNDIARMLDAIRISFIFSTPGEEFAVLVLTKGASGESIFEIASYNWLDIDPLEFDIEAARDTGYAPFSLDPELPGVLFLDGDLTEDAGLAFLDAIIDHPETELLVLRSEGGIGTIGVGIAKMVAEIGLDTVIPHNAFCYSSCAFVFFAGSQHVALGELGVHQSSTVDPTPDPEGARQSTIRNVENWASNAVPLAVVLAALRTPPELIRTFDAEEIDALGIDVGTLTSLQGFTPALLDHPWFHTNVRYSEVRDDPEDEQSGGGTVTWQSRIAAEGSSVIADIDLPDLDLAIELTISGGEAEWPNSHEIRVDFSGPGASDVGSMVGILGISPGFERIWLQTDNVDLEGTSQVLALPGFYLEQTNALLTRNSLALVFLMEDGTPIFVSLDKGYEGTVAFGEAAPSWFPRPDVPIESEVELVIAEAGAEPVVFAGAVQWEAGRTDPHVTARMRVPVLDLWGWIYLWRPYPESDAELWIEFSGPSQGIAPTLETLIAVKFGPNGDAPAKAIDADLGVRDGIFNAVLRLDPTTLALITGQPVIELSFRTETGEDVVLTIDRTAAMALFTDTISLWAGQ